jgi:hypothetical protein
LEKRSAERAAALLEDARLAGNLRFAFRLALRGVI